MQITNEYTKTLPFDLYQIYLFYLVSKTGSFTKAALKAGLTQSAVTRQIALMESKLGIALFSRNTRNVSLTEAGKFFLESSSKIVAEVEKSIQQLGKGFLPPPKVIRIGISKSVSMAYLPGFFVSYRRLNPLVRIEISILPSGKILQGLDARTLEVGLIGHMTRVPASLRIVKGFEDEMVKISPVNRPDSDSLASWLLIDQKSETGKLVSRRFQFPTDRGVVELDSFDLIVNMVGLGVGSSIVPRRSLASFPRKHLFNIEVIKPVLKRRFAVVIAKTKNIPDTIQQFIDCMLFS